MDYTGKLRPKGVSFVGVEVYERIQIHELKWKENERKCVI